ncbi:YlmC/YmxH family sporulation protein [Caproicibacterium sp. NSD3]|uniref:YlmC/YmxH family sporulation protein n=1 Tax=Caproicibacterium sp. BJN0003 TaxID=2994078 RepID=UPI002250EDC1|nr:YlmC/YmxH family sporulation protein [Caproicibacterium sp. BJN0003]UZT81198.1 YlmC/YmxH family sporulation protein [Caproicibacterium sp. BJN0003]
MTCRVFDMRRKEVINIRNGMRLGCVNDVEIDTETANILSLVVYGRLRFFGLFGREEDQIIPWNRITVIGSDTILVDCDLPVLPEHRSLFSHKRKETGKKSLY